MAVEFHLAVESALALLTLWHDENDQFLVNIFVQLFSSLGSTTATYLNINKQRIEYPLRLSVCGLPSHGSCSDSSARRLRSAALQAVKENQRSK